MKTRKRKFNLSKNLQEGIAETINLKENSEGQFRDTAITLSRIETDPDNPRRLAITLEDILSNAVFDAESQKQKELEHLEELAATIEANGVLNPIVVYRFGEKYRIVAGERRFLASNIAKKHNIPARVYNSKPDALQLKVVQWVENTSREDLSLLEKLDNIDSIINHYQATSQSKGIDAKTLAGITGLSSTNTYRFLLLLKSDKSVKQLISSGKLESMQMAEMLASIKDKANLKLAIEAYSKGASLKEIKIIAKSKSKRDTDKAQGKDRKKAKVSFGETANLSVAKIIIEAIAKDPVCKGMIKVNDIDWTDMNLVSSLMRDVIKNIEEKVKNA